MARLTNAERTAIKDALSYDGLSGKTVGALQNLLDKDDASRTRAPGLHPKDFIATLQQVLGPRLALPPKPSDSWYATMARRLREGGVDSESARLAATTAARIWRGPVAAERVLMCISTLTAGPQGGAASGGTVARAEFNPDDLE